MEQNCYMASIDIKDAYYSLATKACDQNFLCFSWKGQLYHFTCLPNGLSSAPRKFTKIFKVPLAHLHKQGHISLGYLDDFYLQGQTYDHCVANVIDTTMLFIKLGLVPHPEKCNFIPSQELTFILNSITMTVKLTGEKATNLQSTCQKLIKCRSPSIREVAQVIGKIVSSFPGTIHGTLYYRHIERDKSLALKQHKGNFDAKMILSDSAKSELTWWVQNITSTFNVISHGQPTFQITTDASLLGWGAECEDVSTGGHWTPVEAKHHINCLEMRAAFLGLQTFAKEKSHIHIRLRLDNTTGVSVLSHMGTNHSVECNNICKEIWEWCINHHIWISTAYLPGKLNTTADAESRSNNNALEWMLHTPTLMKALNSLRCTPDIDLFASRLNKQFTLYAACKPDPNDGQH